MANLGRWKDHFEGRLERQVAVNGDAELAELLEEVEDYPVPEEPSDRSRLEPEPLGVLKVRAPGGGELSFFGMFAIFDTPFEVTASELAIELMFPADATTAEALRILNEDDRVGAGR